MKAHDFDNIFQKSFHELNKDERSEMKELFTTEDEFNQMKFVMQSVQETIRRQEEKNGPSGALKERLDVLYTQTYRNRGILWYNSLGKFFISEDKKWHQQNLLRIAALFILFFTFYPFWNNTLRDEKVQLSQTEISRNEQANPNNATSNGKAQEENETTAAENFALPPVIIPGAVSEDLMDMDFQPEKAAKMAEILEEPKPESFTGMYLPAEDAVFSAISHPDGVFKDEALKVKNSEFTVAKHSDVLDILTATY